MATPALPQPRAAALEGTVPHRRAYRDILGRPMRGTAVITGGVRAAFGDNNIVPAAVTVELVDGVLDVSLPPGDYEIVAMLRTVDGERVSDRDSVQLI